MSQTVKTCFDECCFDCVNHNTRDCVIGCEIEKKCARRKELQGKATCKHFKRKEIVSKFENK